MGISKCNASFLGVICLACDFKWRVSGGAVNLIPCWYLQILEEVIKFRWGALPDEQRIGIRNYVSNLVIKISTNEVLFRQEKMFLNKLNVILVQVRGPQLRSACNVPNVCLFALLNLQQCLSFCFEQTSLNNITEVCGVSCVDILH